LKPGIVVKPPGPKTVAFNKRYERSVTSALPKVSPLVVRDAKGALVRDVDGNVFIDFVAGFAVMSVGHCNPAVVEAVRTQAGLLTHISAHLGSYEPYVSLAEKIRRVAPHNLRDGQVFFSNSGTEAVEAALKLAHHVTRRPLTVAFWPSFHGRTTGALSVTGVSARLKSGIARAEMSGVYFAPYAYCYRCPLKQTYPGCGVACADYLESMFDTVVPPEDTAAIIFEPVAGEPGNIVPPPEFWPKIEKIAKKHGIILIADEVYTGFGRTGAMFACEHWNLKPDIIVFAKAIAGGLPLGGIIAKRELTYKWERGAHGSTYGGNPISCAAGNAALDFITSHHLDKRAERIGNYMLTRLKEMASRYPTIGDVRGKGMMVAIELVKADSKPATELAKKLLVEAYQRGLLIYVAGTHDSVIRMMPPLVIEQELLDQGLEILDASLKAVSK
jgi:4-aminobutyrate aminotransferase